jgi:hypothetical protein
MHEENENTITIGANGRTTGPIPMPVFKEAVDRMTDDMLEERVARVVGKLKEQIKESADEAVAKQFKVGNSADLSFRFWSDGGLDLDVTATVKLVAKPHKER